MPITTRSPGTRKPITPVVVRPYGEAGNNTIYINETRYKNWLYWKATLGEFEAGGFEIACVDVGTTELADIQKDKVVKIFSGVNSLLFKGKINEVKYDNINNINVAIVSGYGMAYELMKRGLERTEYANTATSTIIDNLCSEGLDGSSPWIIEPDGSNENWGNYSFRGEYTNRWNVMANMAKRLGYDLWVATPSHPFDTDYVYFQAERGAGSGSPVHTFTSGSNCLGVSYVEENKNLVNYVKCLGYGDGINQKNASIYAASDVYSELASDLAVGGDTITLDDSSSFPSSGKVKICDEIISYTGNSSNQLTGCTRAQDSTTAIAHPKDVLVFEYYDGTSTYTATKTGSNPAKSGSSIDSYGVFEKTFVDRGLFDDSAIQLWASNLLAKYMDPPKRYVLKETDLANIATINVGDYVTVTDAEAGLSSEVLRVVKKTMVESLVDGESIVYELSNKQIGVINDIAGLFSFEEKSERFAQGATTSENLSEKENLDATNDLDMKFYLPDDVKAINTAKLSFKIDQYRAYAAGNAAGGSNHRHEFTSETVDNDETAEAVNMGFATWDDGTTVDASSTAIDIYVGIPALVDGDTYTGCIVTVGILNKSGSSDTFGYDIINASQSDYALYSNYSVVLADDTATSQNFDIGTAHTAAGNTLKIHFDNGVFGTQASKGMQGNAWVLVQTKSNHDHEMDGVTSDYYNTSHTHSITYNIYKDALSGSETVVVTAGVEGSESAVGTYGTGASPPNNSNTQTAIDLSTQLASAYTANGAGWYNIKFDANEPLRVEANLFLKYFIESKS